VLNILTTGLDNTNVPMEIINFVSVQRYLHLYGRTCPVYERALVQNDLVYVLHWPDDGCFTA